MTEHGIELVEGLVRSRKVDGRSVYDRAAKAELVRRCRQSGVSVARMALAHGVNANLLRKWIMTAPTSLTLPSVALVPVRTRSAELPPATDTGYLELIVAGVTIRVHGLVPLPMLQRTLQCLHHP